VCQKCACLARVKNLGDSEAGYSRRGHADADFNSIEYIIAIKQSLIADFFYSGVTLQSGAAVRVQLPRQMVGDRSNMYEAFKNVAVEYGDSGSYAQELINLLPESIRRAPVWFDNLSKIWRYEFGMPLDRLPEDMLVFGTHMYLPVSTLYCALRIADKWLTRAQLIAFLERLADEGKHADVTFEMRPIKELKARLKPMYEISGLGVGNTTCDWQVKGKLLNIIFDVKNRRKSLVDHLTQLIPDLNRGARQSLPTAPNPEDLFRSVEKKLKERCYMLQLQGVWIHSEIKEDEEKLTAYFRDNLNRKKIHFAILSDWEGDACILARNRMITILLKRTFGLRESKRFVSNDYA